MVLTHTGVVRVGAGWTVPQSEGAWNPSHSGQEQQHGVVELNATEEEVRTWQLGPWNRAKSLTSKSTKMKHKKKKKKSQQT